MKASQRFHKENKMRILAALMPVFMVSVAVAQEDRPTGDWDVNDTIIHAKCQFRSAGASGPIYACKDPKTGKTQEVKCKTPPKQKLPPKITLGELEQICGYVTGDGSDQLQ